MISRKHRAQYKVGQGARAFGGSLQRVKIQPLADTDNDIRYTRIQDEALWVAIAGDFDTYTNVWLTEAKQNQWKSFPTYHHFRGIGYMKDLLGLPGAVLPWLADSYMKSFRSVFGVEKRYWVFWQSLPNTNKQGEAITAEEFHQQWVLKPVGPTDEPRKDLIHHLLSNHAGELVQVGEGEWKVYNGPVPPALFLPQYSIDEEQYHMVNGKGGSKGGKKGWRHKGKGVGAKGGQASASGDDTQFTGWVGFENRIVIRSSDQQYAVWQGPLITLPRLFHALGKAFTAAELYEFWCHCKLRVLHRPHAWGSELRQDAAYERYKSTGYWGHPRRQKP